MRGPRVSLVANIINTCLVRSIKDFRAAFFNNTSLALSRTRGSVLGIEEHIVAYQSLNTL